MYGERYPSFETPRADNGIDCVCVPFDQCLPHEVISRKEDGYAIDPRNSFKTNIEAIGPDDVVITDGNGTVVSVKKLEEVSETTTEDSEKTRRRRDVDSQHSIVESQENKLEAVSATILYEGGSKTRRWLNKEKALGCVLAMSPTYD